MAYTTYEFYKTIYYGKVIETQDDFSRLESKACDKLDFMTFDRLVSGMPTIDPRAATKVQKAVCAVADKLQEIEAAEKLTQAGGYSIDESGNLVGKIIESKSSGSEKITFSSASSVKSAVINVAGDTQAQNRLCYDTAREYLSGVLNDDGVPLLYAGF